jgi:hypothetical protein
MTESQRKRSVRKAGKASGKARRKKAREKLSLLSQCLSPKLGEHSVAIALNRDIGSPMPDQLPGNAGQTCDLGL